MNRRGAEGWRFGVFFRACCTGANADIAIHKMYVEGCFCYNVDGLRKGKDLKILPTILI